MSPVRINLLVALPAEAKPLIRGLGLKRQQPDAGPCPIYIDGGISLAISGPGHTAIQVACRWLLHNHPADQWINIGIAGHPSHSRGSLFCAESVIERNSGHSWQLSPASRLIDYCPLESVAQPEFHYPAARLYEMEAAALLDVLTPSLPLDRIQILKVVSDNHSQPAQQINGKMVSSLIEQNLPLIRNLLQQLQCQQERQRAESYAE